MIYIIVTAAGSGSRFGSTIPKQFCKLEGVPVLCRTLDGLHHALPEAQLVLTLSAAAMDMWEEIRPLCEAKPIVVEGGDTRFASVGNAVRAIKTMAEATDIIMVHDGARPLVSDELCRRVAEESARFGSAIPVCEISDSLRAVDSSDSSHIVDRSKMRAVQTPQGFRADILTSAYSVDYNPSFTDDASVVESTGHTVHLCRGEYTNIKLTRASDMFVAEALLRSLNAEP